LSHTVPLQNNYINLEKHEAHTPRVHDEVAIVSDFQGGVDREIEEYFVPKIDECIQAIERKDFLSLSIKWNIIETLFNIDNISEYIREHIKNPNLQYLNKRGSKSLDMKLAISQFRQVPDKVMRIRSELMNNKDYVQELVGELGTESENKSHSSQTHHKSQTESPNDQEQEQEESEYHEEQEESEKSEEEKEEPIVPLSKNSLTKNDKEQSISNMILETVEEEPMTAKKEQRINKAFSQYIEKTPDPTYSNLPPNPKVEENMKFLSNLREFSRAQSVNVKKL
jgi:hypothetical protein